MKLKFAFKGAQNPKLYPTITKKRVLAIFIYLLIALVTSEDHFIKVFFAGVKT